MFDIGIVCVSLKALFELPDCICFSVGLSYLHRAIILYYKFVA